jgi:hypothetical protein
VKWIYIVTLATVLTPLHGQAPPPPVQRALPDDNLGYPALVTIGNSIGSGFYLNTATATYLVTATHVLFSPPTPRPNIAPQPPQLLGRRLDVLSYSRDPTDHAANRISVDTTVLGEANIIRHPTMDVTVVRLFTHSGTDRLTSLPGVTVEGLATAGILGVGLDGISRFNEVLIGNEVVLFGYPTSLGLQTLPQLDPSHPLLRKGIVAGVNEALHSIILDCPVYPGNSGGPVIEIDQAGPFARRYRMIGVVDQYVPYADGGRTFSIMANSGYSVIVPMDFVLELVN